MKKQKLKFVLSLFLLVITISPLLAQNSKKQMIFAVLNAGKSLEPIVLVENGKLVENEAGENYSWEDFVKTYYKPKTTYNLILGGSASGKVTVTKADAKAECSANVAEISSQTTKAKLGGMVMSLATNATTKKTNGLRRAPTAAERTEIEKLVRAEFTKLKVTAAQMKTLRSHNLTAIDVDGDGNAEMVGTYLVTTSRTERALLFFIAEKSKSRLYAMGFSDSGRVKEDEVMSSEIKALDTGIYNELLLDAFDYDGDGVDEIFTIGQAFEGNNFYVYKRENGKWTKVLETYNYHCAY